MAKKGLTADLKELRTKVQAGAIVVGSERTLKGLRNASIRKVFLASNCPADVKAEIQHYAHLIAIPVVELEQDNEELGVFCKKNFFISVLGVTEE